MNVFVFRFYSHNSSFVHGGLAENGREAEAVFGQQEIHQKIMTLNFRDCHAKIRQVNRHVMKTRYRSEVNMEF